VSYQRNSKKIDHLVENLPASAFENLVEQALAEDLDSADITPAADLTSSWIVAQETEAQAQIITRQQGVVAGLEIARAVFERLDPAMVFTAQLADGSPVGTGHLLVRLQGRAQALLTGERTALNFLQRLSGIATLTSAFVEAIAGTAARITDTRKTTPGFRLLEKYAVRQGGGINHRFGLYDAVLIKENHAAPVGGPRAAIERARQAAVRHQRETIPIFVETRNLDEVRSVLPARPDRIMLDNMAAAILHEAVQLIRRTAPQIEIEATGGITLDNVRSIALTGVDLISIGALTHSAPALDLSLLFDA
jgi:nicotinate-nucleotide pyrophosphorylase (carboxylating)